MILYDDITMVLEAMDIDPVMGDRDWVSGYHVEDALALAEAAFWSQARRPKWTSMVAGDPFAQELARWQDELMIEPTSSTWDRPVKPSYFTWRPGPEYIAQKICDFLNDRQRFPHANATASWRALSSRTATSASMAKILRVTMRLDRNTPQALAEVPVFHAYETPRQLKAELTRYLFAALEVVVAQRGLGYGVMRAPFFDAMSFVDGLWGADEYVN